MTAGETWQQRVDDYLAWRGPQVLGESLQRWVSLAEDVWLLEGVSGARVVAKHQLYGVFTRGAAFDLLDVEMQVLQLLNGLPVPRVKAVDRGDQFIFFSYCGAATLEEAGRGDSAALAALAQQAAAGLLAIEACLAGHQAELAGRIAPEATAKTLEGRWQTAGETARLGLAALPDGAAAASLLEELLERLGRRPPRLGCADYNGRNIVVDDNGNTTFIEFAKIGWDWTERRLLQYTTVVDGGRDWLCPWEDDLVAAYGGAGGDAAALEGHRLIFHLNALARSAGTQRRRIEVGLGASVEPVIHRAVERLRHGRRLNT